MKISGKKWLVAVLVLIFVSGCFRGKLPATTVTEKALSIKLDFHRQSGYATNQFAVWITDENGLLVRTLYATKFTATGGYKKRPEALPLWVEKSQLASLNKKTVDTFTGATPKTGALEYFWDFNDQAGNRVADGEYNYLIEANLRWNNRVIYRGTVTIGETITVGEAEREYLFATNAEQPALTEDATEVKMITAVNVTYLP